MDDPKSLINQLSEKLKNKSLKDLLNKLNEDLKSNSSYYETKKEAIEDSIHQIQRRNNQIETEIERQQLQQSKNTAIFGKRSTERIKYSRKIIELEQDNEVLEMSITELEDRINRVEDEIKGLGYPTLDELYYEIVKGFGVEFTEENGVQCAKIKNKSKNDVFTVECVGNPTDVCEKIWESIE